MMKAIDWIAMVLVIVGGLNWGLVGLLNYDLVASLLGAGSIMAKVAYDLVGLGALWMIYHAYKEM